MNREQSDPSASTLLNSIPYEHTKPLDFSASAAIHTSSSSEGAPKPANVPNSPSANAPSNIKDGENVRQNTGFASNSIVSGGTPTNTENEPARKLTSARSVPQIRLQNEQSERSSSPKREPTAWLSRKSSKPTTVKPRVDSVFHGITLDIPSGRLGDEIPTSDITFSNRGSVLVDGKKLNGAQSRAGNIASGAAGRAVRPSSSMRVRTEAKVLSVDEEQLSQKVRTFYEVGGELPAEHDGNSSLGRKMGLRWQDALHGQEGQSTSSVSRATSNSDLRSITSSIGQRQGTTLAPSVDREENELAGGVEDWQDIDSGDVDRYGFIIPKSPASQSSGVKRSASSREPHSMRHVSSSLQLASDTPRRQNTFRRSPGDAQGPAPSTPASDTVRPASSQSHRANPTRRRPSFRYATNRLPHNRDRRFTDEASDMLTLPPTSTGLSQHSQRDTNGSHVTPKEIEREGKWRKMARVVSSGPQGGGMVFEFDTRSPKLVERTWKGIPDRWRATAWHAFLLASAKKSNDYSSDEDLTEAYHDYLQQSPPDDVQIDIDIPRTINSHIMFRRRYRGGQRLLFHVLHAMSLHFPDTGYVQGMAALAATLLAYYEEEKAFIMLVRLWDLRGLDKLYKAGFGGLMEALDDFEKQWLGQGELAAKLVRFLPRVTSPNAYQSWQNTLGIGPTAYGTRWYLTLFNYSIPFPAQLRVWDVFMLLGDNDQESKESESTHFGTTLDVLHATSAALIDGMRDIILDSDFENSMKVLTSWIPIKDEDLFMRVAKAEWKVHKRKG